MLGKRLELANKKAEKRWKYFHQDVWDAYHAIVNRLGKLTDRGPSGVYMTRFPVIGFYRRNKGCECRGCSIGKQHEKRQRVVQLRREARRAKKDIPG